MPTPDLETGRTTRTHDQTGGGPTRRTGGAPATPGDALRVRDAGPPKREGRPNAEGAAGPRRWPASRPALANGPRPGRGETASTSDALNRVSCARPLTRDTLAVPQHPVELPARGNHGATEPGTNHSIRCQGTGAAQTPDGTKPTGPDPHGPGQPEARERAGGPKTPDLRHRPGLALGAVLAILSLFYRGCFGLPDPPSIPRCFALWGAFFGPGARAGCTFLVKPS